LTFADGKEPQILAALKKSKLPFSYEFRFNNSAMFAPANDSFKEMFWKMGMTSFENFFNVLPNIQSKSLTLTKDNLKVRHNLENVIQNFQVTIDNALVRLNGMEVLITTLTHNIDRMNKLTDFNISVPVTITKEIALPSGRYTTLCRSCCFTCHRCCCLFNDSQKKHCAMDRNGFCTVCPDTCHWSLHNNVGYTIKRTPTTRLEKSSELYAKYKKSVGKTTMAERVLDGEFTAFVKLQEKTAADIRKVHGCIAKLQKIALQPNVLNMATTSI